MLVFQLGSGKHFSTQTPMHLLLPWFVSTADMFWVYRLDSFWRTLKQQICSKHLLHQFALSQQDQARDNPKKYLLYIQQSFLFCCVTLFAKPLSYSPYFIIYCSSYLLTLSASCLSSKLESPNFQHYAYVDQKTQSIDSVLIQQWSSHPVKLVLQYKVGLGSD